MESIILWLLGQGAFSSFAVSLLKRIAWVERFPKLAAAIINIVIGLLVAHFGTNVPHQFIDFLTDLVVSLGGSVLTYETLTKPLTKAAGNAVGSIDK